MENKRTNDNDMEFLSGGESNNISKENIEKNDSAILPVQNNQSIQGDEHNRGAAVPSLFQPYQLNQNTLLNNDKQTFNKNSSTKPPTQVFTQIPVIPSLPNPLTVSTTTISNPTTTSITTHSSNILTVPTNTTLLQHNNNNKTISNSNDKLATGGNSEQDNNIVKFTATLIFKADLDRSKWESKSEIMNQIERNFKLSNKKLAGPITVFLKNSREIVIKGERESDFLLFENSKNIWVSNAFDKVGILKCDIE